MTSYELYEKLSERFSKSLSCEWDNDGIAVSSGPVCNVEKVLIALDATERALEYAASNDFNTVVTHHPMIFKGVKNVTPETNIGRKIIFAIMNGITVMSFHTRLDAAVGGVNDALCDVLDITGSLPFGNAECPNMGRIGCVKDATVSELFEKVKKALGNTCRCYTACKDDICSKIAVLGGSGKDFVYDAKKAGADVIVTGEASYNFLLDAAENGISVITAGHFETEFPVCEKLKCEILKICPDIYTEVYSDFDDGLFTV